MHRGRKNPLKGNGGTTLVELVVVFALMGIFAACTAQIISVSLRQYQQVRDYHNCLQIAETVLDKVSGTIEGAQKREITYHSDRITLWDDTGSHLTVTQAGGYLKIHYDEADPYEATDWTFDPNLYAGYEIGKLEFSRNTADYPENVFRVDLELKKGDFTYHATRYAECYNFTESLDFPLIHQED